VDDDDDDGDGSGSGDEEDDCTGRHLASDICRHIIV